MLRLPRLLIACLGPIVAGAVVVIVLSHQAKTTASGTSNCAVSTAAFPAGTTYGRFVQLVDQTMNASPVHQSQLTTPGPLQRNFQNGRLIGWLNAISLQNPYRQEEDAEARSLHYTIGRFPFVPLSGNVVRDQPGLLEVYVTHMVFTDEATALQMLDVFRTSNASYAIHNSTLGQDLPLNTHWSAYLQRGATAETETYLGVAFVHGDTYVSVSFQGGRGVNQQLVHGYLRFTERQLTATCG